MQLVIKQGGTFVKEMHFARGPLYIGRNIESHICLADLSVSRQHAVLFGADESKWFAQDLDSANKTYLNDKAVHKSEVKDGDILRIAGFTVEIHLKKEHMEEAEKISMTDTMAMAVNAPETIIRRYAAKEAPDIKMPATRAAEYAYATMEIHKADSAEKLLETLLAVVDKQFKIFHIWIGLRTDSKSEFPIKAGYKNTGQKLELENLIFREKIKEACEKQQYTLIPLLPKDKLYEHTRSAVIAPILGHDGCLGVIYADNATDQRHYSLTDLDYLMLLATQAAAIMQAL
jgi:pSer/pThr/pTyr-binding forkhead associated (FHA) protein